MRFWPGLFKDGGRRADSLDKALTELERRMGATGAQYGVIRTRDADGRPLKIRKMGGIGGALPIYIAQKHIDLAAPLAPWVPLTDFVLHGLLMPDQGSWFFAPGDEGQLYLTGPGPTRPNTDTSIVYGPRADTTGTCAGGTAWATWPLGTPLVAPDTAYPSPVPVQQVDQFRGQAWRHPKHASCNEMRLLMQAYGPIKDWAQLIPSGWPSADARWYALHREDTGTTWRWWLVYLGPAGCHAVLLDIAENQRCANKSLYDGFMTGNDADAEIQGVLHSLYLPQTPTIHVDLITAAEMAPVHEGREPPAYGWVWDASTTEAQIGTWEIVEDQGLTHMEGAISIVTFSVSGGVPSAVLAVGADQTTIKPGLDLYVAGATSSIPWPAGAGAGITWNSAHDNDADLMPLRVGKEWDMLVRRKSQPITDGASPPTPNPEVEGSGHASARGFSYTSQIIGGVGLASDPPQESYGQRITEERWITVEAGSWTDVYPQVWPGDAVDHSGGPDCEPVSGHRQQYRSEWYRYWLGWVGNQNGSLGGAAGYLSDFSEECAGGPNGSPDGVMRWPTNPHRYLPASTTVGGYSDTRNNGTVEQFVLLAPGGVVIGKRENIGSRSGNSMAGTNTYTCARAYVAGWANYRYDTDTGDYWGNWGPLLWQDTPLVNKWHGITPTGIGLGDNDASGTKIVSPDNGVPDSWRWYTALPSGSQTVWETHLYPLNEADPLVLNTTGQWDAFFDYNGVGTLPGYTVAISANAAAAYRDSPGGTSKRTDGGDTPTGEDVYYIGAGK